MLFDITPPISAALAVWPGDVPPSREVLCDMRRGDNLTLSALRATVHLGAHADAPSHYGTEAASIERQPLEPYLGRCQVIHVAPDPGGTVLPGMLPRRIEAERVLIATGSYPDATRFNEDFAALSPALVDLLHGQSVCLVGIDTPSIDPFHSKELPAHQACLRTGMAVLEGLVLGAVPAGIYELIALPLKLTGFDASPVRAVLRTL